MASVRREVVIANSASNVWSAMRDFHAVHTRVAPGFVTSLEPDGDARLVTFANGNTARELLVDCNDDDMRLVYAIAGGRMTVYNAAVQIFPDGTDKCRLVWIVDLLPNDFGGYIAAQMDTALPIMARTLADAKT